MNDCCFREFMQCLVLTEAQKKEIYVRFMTQVKKGLGKTTNKEAEIKCYLTYVQDLPTSMEVGKYLALDLGGTNFRVLLVVLEGNGLSQFASKAYEIPKSLMVGPGAMLFDFIAQCLARFLESQDLLNESLDLGFTFSFPCIQKGLDKALLVTWTKGFNCPDVVGKDVGVLLREAINKRNLRVNVSAILNDTIGTLMSTGYVDPRCRIGVIIGTGCNGCFVEKVECLGLLDPIYKSKPYMIVNAEWGAFGDKGSLDFIRTEYDRYIDVHSINKGKQLHEKMNAGMYLGELVRLVLQKALQQGLIFKDPAHKNFMKQVLKKEDCITTTDLSNLETDEPPESYPATRTFIKMLCENMEDPALEDLQKFHYVSVTIMRRSADLIGIAIGCLINRVKEPDVVIAIDGSVYRFSPNYPKYLREAIDNCINPGITYELVLSEDGSGRGAALVAACAATDNK